MLVEPDWTLVRSLAHLGPSLLAVVVPFAVVLAVLAVYARPPVLTA